MFTDLVCGARRLERGEQLAPHWWAPLTGGGQQGNCRVAGALLLARERLPSPAHTSLPSQRRAAPVSRSCPPRGPGALKTRQGDHRGGAGQEHARWNPAFTRPEAAGPAAAWAGDPRNQDGHLRGQPRAAGPGGAGKGPLGSPSPSGSVRRPPAAHCAGLRSVLSRQEAALGVGRGRSIPRKPPLPPRGARGTGRAQHASRLPWR